MRLVKQIVTGALIGGCLTVMLCDHLIAQTFIEDSARDVSSVRSNWENRVLKGHSEPARDGIPATMVSTSGGPIAGEFGRGQFATVSDEVQFDTLPPDDTYEDLTFDEPGFYEDGPQLGGCGGCGDCGGCEVCNQCGFCDEYDCGGCGPGLCWFGSAWWARDLSVFAGVHGFKGPPDQGRVGNFGFHEGVNFGAPLGGYHGLGYQIGFAAMHSNFCGDQAQQPGQVRRGDRNQVFLTAGIFRRSLSWGWDWGVAFDLAHDNYYDTTDLKQIRTETSFARHGNWQMGFWGAYGIDSEELTINQNPIELEPTDQFAIFYRRFFQNGGDGRFWAGFSGDGDGVLGAEAEVPLGCGWALESRVNYLIPKQGSGLIGMTEESWSLTMRVVWYLGQPARCAMESPYRPVLKVADNGMFMSDIR